MRVVLANVNFRRLWISQVILTLGGALMQMGLIELFRVRGYDVRVETAKLSLAVALPGLLLGPVAMRWLDRWQRRRVMMIGDTLRAVLAMLIGLWLVPMLSGRPQPRGLWPVYLLIGIIGVIATFYLPARSALIPNLIGADQLMKANSLFTSSLAIAAFGGAAFGGFLAERMGTTTAIVLAGLSFLVSLGMLWTIHMPPHATTDGNLRGPQGKLREGCVYLWKHPTALPLVLLSGLFAFLLGILLVVFFGYAIKTLGLGTAGAGYLIAGGGLGAGVGIVLLGRGKPWAHSGWVPFFQLLLAACALLALGLTTRVWLAAPAVVVLGGVSATVLIYIDAKLQGQVEDVRRGAVFAARGMLTSATMIVAFALQIWTSVLRETPPHQVLTWLGVCSGVGAVLMLLAVRRRSRAI